MINLKILSVVSVLLFLTSVIETACPFSDQSKAKSSDQLPRGHNKPFGHHAKHWRRIETVYEHPDPETFYNNYVRLSKPLVIKGGAADWPAIKKWTNVSYINEIGGKERSHVNWKKIYDYDRHHAIRIDMTMKEFTSKFDDHDLYMDATIQAGLHKDVYWPHSLGCQFFLKRVKQLAIMMNNGKSKSDVHIDVTDTYFMQATGERLWLLSPPSNVTNVYSGRPHLVDHSGISILNQSHVDLQKHSDASKLIIYAAYLYPGDIAYVPEAWYHQVVTHGSPNIAIVAFMNVMFCEYFPNVINDTTYVRDCYNTVRERKPKKLECKAFPKDKMTVDQLLKKYKPRTLSGFQGYFGTSPTTKRYKYMMRRLSDKSVLPAIGMSLTGMSQAALNDGSVLKQGYIEGYRLFCIAPDDGSEEALSKFVAKIPRTRNTIRILSYISVNATSPEAVAASIEKSLSKLKTSFIDFVLLSAPYCTPDYQVEACTRNDFKASWADTWKALEALQRAGKVRFLGVSDFSLKELQALESIATVPITIARARFDVYFRNKEFRRYCKKHRIHFMGRSLLGHRWRTEQPNYPRNRDIFKEYQLQKGAYQYKVSIHALVYDWAIKKGIIVCPKVNDPLHVRVNIKAVDSESKDNEEHIKDVNMIDPTDTENNFVNLVIGGEGPPTSPQEKSERGTSPERQGTEDEAEDDDDDKSQKEDNPTIPEKDMYGRDGVIYNPGNFSNMTYTDEKDFEMFPTYMLSRDSG